jgi:hypothetical protein
LSLEARIRECIRHELLVLQSDIAGSEVGYQVGLSLGLGSETIEACESIIDVLHFPELSPQA